MTNNPQARRILKLMEVNQTWVDQQTTKSTPQCTAATGGGIYFLKRLKKSLNSLETAKLYVASQNIITMQWKENQMELEE